MLFQPMAGAPETTVEITVAHAPAGEVVLLVAGPPGGASCALDLCVATASPQLLDAAVADADGVAVFVVRTPAELPDLVLQAVAPAAGETSAPWLASELAAGWSGAAPLLEALQDHAAVELAGELVVIGGIDAEGMGSDRVEAWDPAGDLWRSLAPLPQPLYHANAAVVGGTLYVVGGLAPGGQPIGTVFVYDAGDDRWSSRSGLPARRAVGAAVVGVLGGRIHLVGGVRNGQAAKLHTAWSPATGQAQALAPPSLGRNHASGGVVAGTLVVVGGRGGSLTSVNRRLELYDPGANAWIRGAPMPTARAGAAGAVGPDGRLHVLGGEGNAAEPSGVFDDHEAWDPATGEWAVLPPMATPRHGTGAVTLGGTLWLPGGGAQSPFGPTDVLEGWTP